MGGTLTVHAKIEYLKNGKLVRLTISPPQGDFDRIDDKYRQILHSYLDEWFNESGGGGGFYIKQEGYAFGAQG